MIVSFWGMMGSGKSTLGKILASELNMVFIDLDLYIENKLNKSITTIFTEDGEDYFRLVERNCIINILGEYSEGNVILATGGGTPCYFGNATLLNENTFSIYLKSSVNILSERVEHDTNERPLILHKNKEELEEELVSIIHRRKTYYEMAKCVVDTESMTFEQTKEILINIISKTYPKKFK